MNGLLLMCRISNCGRIENRITLEAALLDKVRICFVCLGNIVRSPLAENLFRYHAEERRVSHKYQIDSAGTSNWHIGEPPDPRMSRVAAKRDVNIDGTARQFKISDFIRFDLIIPMDNNNYDTLMALAQTPEARNKIHLLREFDPIPDSGSSVPDPYYGGILGFEEVFDIIDRSTLGLLESLETRMNGDDN